MIEAPDTGRLAAATLAGLAIGRAGLVAFVLVELRMEHPSLGPRTFTFVILQCLQLLTVMSLPRCVR